MSTSYRPMSPNKRNKESGRKWQTLPCTCLTSSPFCPAEGAQSAKETGEWPEWQSRAVKVAVSNLPHSLTRADFEAALKGCSHLAGTKFFTRSGSVECRGLAFCYAEGAQGAEALIAALGTMTFNGQTPVGNLASAKRPARSSDVKDSHRKERVGGDGTPGLVDVSEGEEGRVRKRRGGVKKNITTSQVATSRQRRKDDDILSQKVQDDPEVKDDARSDGGLSGEAILAAMSRVSAQRAQTKANKGRTKTADVDSGDSDEEGGLNPLVFRAEWGNQIQELRYRLQYVKRMVQ